MEDILDLHHDDLNYEKDLEEGSSPAKKVCVGCPVEGCKFDPGRCSLEEHWHNMHQEEVLLMYCPQPRCGFWSRTLDKLNCHLGERYRVTSAQCSTVMALPAVEEMKMNFGSRDPGNVSALVSPDAVPMDAIHPSEKKTMEGLVESAIRDAALPVAIPAVPVPVVPVFDVPIPPVPDFFCGATCAPLSTTAAGLTITDSCTETRTIPHSPTAQLATLASHGHSAPDGDASSSLLAPEVAEEASVSSAATTNIALDPSLLPAEEQLEDLMA